MLRAFIHPRIDRRTPDERELAATVARAERRADEMERRVVVLGEHIEAVRLAVRRNRALVVGVPRPVPAQRPPARRSATPSAAQHRAKRAAPTAA